MGFDAARPNSKGPPPQKNFLRCIRCMHFIGGTVKFFYFYSRTPMYFTHFKKNRFTVSSRYFFHLLLVSKYPIGRVFCDSNVRKTRLCNCLCFLFCFNFCGNQFWFFWRRYCIYYWSLRLDSSFIVEMDKLVDAIVLEILYFPFQRLNFWKYDYKSTVIFLLWKK